MEQQTQAMTKRYLVLQSPVGELLLRGDERTLNEVRFAQDDAPHEIDPSWQRGGPVLEEAARQLRAYFAGELRDFDVPHAAAGTEFMQRVWKELTRIPFGETISYGELAQRIGKPSASRAVGAANGRNPLPIFVPCHRVIGSNGSLTGFAGGLAIKERLLMHEQSHSAKSATRAKQTTFLPPP